MKQSLVYVLICLQLMVCSALSAESGQLAGLESATYKNVAGQISERVVHLRIYGDPNSTSSEPIKSASGVLLDSEGWIVASDYGMEENPAAVIVVDRERKQHPAKLVGRDLGRRIVLLRTDPWGIEPPPLELVSEVRVGQRAIAFGKALDPESPYVTVGIISAMRRLSGRAIQTDAAVSPLNYGGPLVDLRGQAIGLLVPMAPPGQRGTDWYDSGVGFAVPWPAIESRLPLLKQGDQIEPGSLGISFGSKENPYITRPIINEVATDSAAAEAGLVSGDLLQAINLVETPTQSLFKQVLGPYDSGTQVMIRLIRNGETKNVVVTLQSRRKKADASSKEERRLE